MKKTSTFSLIGILTSIILIVGNVQAEGVANTPISADQAFDAYANQVDPESGESANVIIVDVRTAAEYFWVGTPAEVKSIVPKFGDEIKPYQGKVKLRLGGRFLKFKVENDGHLRPVFLPVSQVDAIKTSPIADHIPLKTWDEERCSLDDDNTDFFRDQLEALAGEDTVIILMCRSGKRSNFKDFAREDFKAVYEIDQPDGTDGRGGFEGTNYSSVYNGYRGFPGRFTRKQESPSVSWADSGLPIHIGAKPCDSATAE